MFGPEESKEKGYVQTGRHCVENERFPEAAPSNVRIRSNDVGAFEQENWISVVRAYLSCFSDNGLQWREARTEGSQLATAECAEISRMDRFQRSTSDNACGCVALMMGPSVDIRFECGQDARQDAVVGSNPVYDGPGRI